MRRFKVYIVLVTLVIVATNSSVLALEEKVVNGIIVHDSSNPKLITNFIEDVVSLLPPEMVQTLEPHLGTLNRSANFNISDDYLLRQVISMNDFKGSLERISIKDGSELARQLGSSVKHIFEVAMRSNGNNDLLNEGLQKNLRKVVSRWRAETFTITYDGYSGQPLDTILSTLYEYKNRQKITLYPELVKTTADLWSAVWQRGGGKTVLITKSFVRKQTEFNFRKNQASGPTPRPTPSKRR